VVARVAHNHQVAGSSPALATPTQGTFMKSIVITVHNGSDSAAALVKTWKKKDEGREFLPNGEETVAPKASANFIVDENKSIEVVPLPAPEATPENGAA
jgi:thymidine kinase